MVSDASGKLSLRTKYELKMIAWRSTNETFWCFRYGRDIASLGNDINI